MLAVAPPRRRLLALSVVLGAGRGARRGRPADHLRLPDQPRRPAAGDPRARRGDRRRPLLRHLAGAAALRRTAGLPRPRLPHPHRPARALLPPPRPARPRRRLPGSAAASCWAASSATSTASRTSTCGRSRRRWWRSSPGAVAVARRLPDPARRGSRPRRWRCWPPASSPRPLTRWSARSAGRRQGAARAELGAELVEIAAGSAEIAVAGRAEDWIARAERSSARLAALQRRDALSGGLAAGLAHRARRRRRGRRPRRLDPRGRQRRPRRRAAGGAGAAGDGLLRGGRAARRRRRRRSTPAPPRRAGSRRCSTASRRSREPERAAAARRPAPCELRGVRFRYEERRPVGARRRRPARCGPGRVGRPARPQRRRQEHPGRARGALPRPARPADRRSAACR